MRDTWILTLILCLIWQPAYAAIDSSIGIMRVGGLLSLQEERAYRLVEQKVGRWLERQGFDSPTVKTLETSYTTEQVRLEADRARLLRQADRLWSAGLEAASAKESVDWKALEKDYRETNRSRLLAEKFLRFGPSIQKALLAEALYWHVKEDSRSEPLIQKAVALHPDLKVDTLVDWGQSPLAEKIREAQEQKRICTLELSVSPNGSEVSINGFEVGNRRVFGLAPASTFIVGVLHDGFHGYHRVFRCERQHTRKLIVRLDKNLSRWTERQPALDQISQRHQVRSLFLISPNAEEFELYLYTPGLSVDRVPTRMPIRVAEVLENPVDSAVPIRTDAFKAILKKHEEASPLYLLPDPVSVAPPTGGELQQSLQITDNKSEWYEQWTTWAIIGGIVGGVVLAFTQSRSQVRTENQAQRNGVEIRF